MYKKLAFLVVIFNLLVIFTPINTKALSCENVNFSNNFNILATASVTSTDDLDDWLNDYDQDQDCDGSNSILGDPNDEDSVAWLLQQILNYIKVIGPILVVVLSSIDFAMVIIKSDDEAMGKAAHKLGIRLILAASLFFIPTLVEVILDIFGFTSSATCGLQ
jgi:hypothetical protein